MGWFKKAFRKVRKGVKKASKKVRKLAKKALPAILPIAGTFLAPGIGTFLGKKLGGVASKLLSKKRSPRIEQIKQQVEAVHGQGAVNSYLQDFANKQSQSFFTPPSNTATHTPTIYSRNFRPQKTLTLKQFQPNPSYKPLGAGQGVYTNEGWKQHQGQKSGNNNMMMLGLGALALILMGRK